MLLRVTSATPRSRAMASRSRAKPLPARACPLFQLADDQRVDVLVRRAVVEAGRRRLRADPVQSCDDPLALVRIKDTGALDRPRICLRAADVRVQQPPVEIQRSREPFED